jgi:hypothetical protein
LSQFTHEHHVAAGRAASVVGQDGADAVQVAFAADIQQARDLRFRIAGAHAHDPLRQRCAVGIGDVADAGGAGRDLVGAEQGHGDAAVGTHQEHPVDVQVVEDGLGIILHDVRRIGAGHEIVGGVPDRVIGGLLAHVDQLQVEQDVDALERVRGIAAFELAHAAVHHVMGDGGADGHAKRQRRYRHQHGLPS